MRYRPHKGSLADSMAEVADVDGMVGLLDLLQISAVPWPTIPPISAETVHVSSYYGDDDRIGWKDIHIVTLDGYGVLGFCEGPL